MPVELFTDIAYAALALLVAVLAIYLAIRLLGKLAKFIIFVVVVVLVLWFIFSDNSILQTVSTWTDGLKNVGTVWDFLHFGA
ncbi:MAG: hypothetical protein IJX39_04295 [Clostridia bacterium]|nr:hypothetical protein [Clostridia bacterium]